MHELQTMTEKEETLEQQCQTEEEKETIETAESQCQTEEEKKVTTEE